METLNTSLIKPILVFAYGNLSRGDDALGPLLLEHIESHCSLERVELLTDFQLQVEHALDLENRELVLFVDASMASIDSFAFERLIPAKDKSYTTHAMSPASVLAVFQSIHPQAPPTSFLLSIKGEAFELGASLSLTARNNLTIACQFAERLLSNPDLHAWERQSISTSTVIPYSSDPIRSMQHA